MSRRQHPGRRRSGGRRMSGDLRAAVPARRGGLRAGPGRPDLQRPPAGPLPRRGARGRGRARRRGRRAARRRARLAGQRPLRRPLLGRLEPARRRAADRPRRAARRCRTTRRPASSRAGPATKGALELAPYLAERGRAFPVGHCASVGIGGYLLQGGQGWNGRAQGLGLRERRRGRRRHRRRRAGPGRRRAATPTSTGPRAAPGPGFPGVVTRFHLQTYPEAGGDVAGHLDLPPRRRRGGRALAARRAARPGPPGRAGARGDPAARRAAATTGSQHPGGTLLLLHTTCMADSDEEVLRLLDGLRGRPARRPRARPRHRARRPSLEENAAQTAQNPEGYRYAVDCAWTDASADVLAPLLLDIWRGLDTEHSFSIWYGWAPSARAAGHGVLGRGQRLRRDVPDLRRRGGRRALPQPGARADRRDRPRRRGRASTSATPTSPGGPDRFLSDEHFRRLERDPGRAGPRTGASRRTSSPTPERLNVHV